MKKSSGKKNKKETVQTKMFQFPVTYAHANFTTFSTVKHKYCVNGKVMISFIFLVAFASVLGCVLSQVKCTIPLTITLLSLRDSK